MEGAMAESGLELWDEMELRHFRSMSFLGRFFYNEARRKEGLPPLR